MDQPPYEQIIAALSARYVHQGQAVPLRQASAEDIQWLRAMAVPETIVSFFAMAEPSRWIDSEGVEIGPIVRLKDDNANAVPGVAASQFGYVVIAKTISGDAYCVDTNGADDTGHTPIYIVSHDKVGQFASREDVEAGSRLVTTSFMAFLERFVAGDLPYDFDQAEDPSS